MFARCRSNARAPLWSPAVLAADGRLARMANLDTGWMNGLKFFLREDVPICNGHSIYSDSPWQIWWISQAQFWAGDFAATYGDGRTRGCLSAVIANWTAPGVQGGRAARDCTPPEIASDAWEQIKQQGNKPGEAPTLTDDLVLSVDIDPGMVLRDGHLVSEDPLALPTAGQRVDRPGVSTAIPNLLLAGDYLDSEWQVGNMEAASYNARRAVNEILDKAGSGESPCAAIGPYQPPEWEPFKQLDAQRYASGQPNFFEAPTELTQDVEQLLDSLNLGQLTQTLGLGSLPI